MFSKMWYFHMPKVGVWFGWCLIQRLKTHYTYIKPYPFLLCNGTPHPHELDVYSFYTKLALISSEMKLTKSVVTLWTQFWRLLLGINLPRANSFWGVLALFPLHFIIVPKMSHFEKMYHLVKEEDTLNYCKKTQLCFILNKRALL